MSRRGALALSLAIVAVSALPACDGELHFDVTPEGPLDASSADAGDAVADGGSAGACVDDAPCAALGSRCDRPTGLCVACLGDAECRDPARPRCDVTRGVCVACVDASDCGPRAACEPTTHRCVGTCAEGMERCDGAGFVCDEHAGRCVECTRSAHCVGSPNGDRCDAVLGACVACAGNATCPREAPICDRRSGRCVGCVSSAECPRGQACDPAALVCRALSL